MTYRHSGKEILSSGQWLWSWLSKAEPKKSKTSISSALRTGRRSYQIQKRGSGIMRSAIWSCLTGNRSKGERIGKVSASDG